MDYAIKPIGPEDRAWVLGIVRGWGADFIVSRGRKVFAADLPGFIARTSESGPVGLVTYEIIGEQCEIVTLDAFERFRGIGTDLTERVRSVARAAGCKRLWLITTNDNLDAVRFYQRRGFTIAAVHVNALAHSRQLKPSIPEIGSNGIPIRDEIEFETLL